MTTKQIAKFAPGDQVWRFNPQVPNVTEDEIVDLSATELNGAPYLLGYYLMTPDHRGEATFEVESRLFARTSDGREELLSEMRGHADWLKSWIDDIEADPIEADRRMAQTAAFLRVDL